MALIKKIAKASGDCGRRSAMTTGVEVEKINGARIQVSVVRCQ